MHDPGLIVTLTAALAVALVLGYVTQRLKLSPILGYILAGVLIGPHTPGFAADLDIASQFAEIGVVLLMFGVGLHFHVRDLLAVRSIAITGAAGQCLLATLLGTGLAAAFGWRLGSALVFGVSISIASTVVVTRILTDRRELDTPQGRVAVGWLVVQDVFTVLVLVLLPTLAHAFGGQGGVAGAGGVLWALGGAILKLALLGALMLLVGARVIPWLLVRVARTRSSELFTLSVLALALVIATGSSFIFGASMALGAFLAGVVVGQTELSHQAAADALPMRDAFAVLFFVSVGMLFDPRVLIAQPGFVLGTLAIIFAWTPLVALTIVVLKGYSVRTALTVAVGLAQIGEFSFILAVVGRQLDVLPAAGQSVLVAASLVSIAVSPLLFRAIEPLEARLRRSRRLWPLLNRRAEERAQGLNLQTAARLAAAPEAIHAVVVGYGPVGQTVARILREFGIQPVIVDLNVDTVRELVARGHEAIYGDGARDEILVAAGIERARYLLVTPPDLASRIPVIVTARLRNPDIKILVRARYLAERVMLEEIGATAVCYEEAEAAVALAAFLLHEVGAPHERIDEEADKIREEFAVRTWRSLLAEAGAPPGAPPGPSSSAPPADSPDGKPCAK